MRKVNFITISLVVTLLISLSSCLKTEMGDAGPKGPVGEKGPAGPPGEKGPTGESADSRTVYYSDWIKTTSTGAGRDWVATIDAPEITADNIDDISVVMFFTTHFEQADIHSFVYKLPYTGATGSGSIVYFTVEPQKIVVHSSYNLSPAANAVRYNIISLNPDGELGL